jgi:hypothetical protein
MVKILALSACIKEVKEEVKELKDEREEVVGSSK